ncbi:MAG: c-type cytochrome [Nitrospirales bacterium]|nr:c-type cytochrome [Nitrospirales bacterium]
MDFKHVVFFMMIFSLSTNLAFARGQHMMEPRVPADKIEEARALKNPLSDSPDVWEKGKALYEGKGTCVNCHGITGHGNGPGAANLDPPPRVFRSRGFWMHRAEGEIFWVIKHGSPGTAMIPFGGLLSDEEIWTVMRYERSFAAKRGRGGRHGVECCDGMGQGRGFSGKKRHGMKRHR